MISFVIGRPDPLWFDDHCQHAIATVRGLDIASIVESALHHAFDASCNPNGLADDLLVDVLEQHDEQDQMDVTTSLTAANQAEYLKQVALLEVQVGDVTCSLRRALQTTIERIGSYGEVQLISNFKMSDSDSYSFDVVYKDE